MENMNTFNFKQNPQAASPFIFSIAWNRPSLVRDFNPLFKLGFKKIHLTYSRFSHGFI